MPKKKHIEAAILVIDQSFGTIRLSEGQVAVGLDLAAGVARALETLRAASVRVALAYQQDGSGPSCTRVGIPSIDVPVLKVRGAAREWVARCIAELDAPAGATVFSSADIALRDAAHALGLPVVPHAAISAWIANGRNPVFVRIEAPREVLSRVDELVAYYVDHSASGIIAWGTVPADSLEALVQSGVLLQGLHIDPNLADPYLYRFEGRLSKTARKSLGELDIIWSDGNVALLGVPPSKSEVVERLASRQHGAIQAPTPSMALLQPQASSWTAARIPAVKRAPVERSVPSGQSESSGFAGPTNAGVQFDVARYSGAAPIDASGTILSRHVHHPHAARAVQSIIADLEAVGYMPYTHTFSYQGKVLSNVIADLPGTGSSPLPQQSLARLRDAIRSHVATPKLLSSLSEEFWNGWALGEKLEELPAARLVAEVERRFGLGGWIPWWRGAASTPGFGAEIVIVGCHLDSTAQGSTGFNPTTSPAPGADDNASGIACTLAAARYLAGLRGTLTHTVRFCFFNAEEQGLIGSSSYANYLKSTGAPVKAVICVDMVGYDVQGSHSFEIHAGATDPVVRNASVLVAQTIAKLAAELTTLAPAQIYRGTSSAEQPNRDLYDPAIGRADHASFQNQGFTAVVVSEDYFINQAGEDAPEPNPNYHRFTDTSVNADYVADIARAITRAAEELAQ